MKNVFYLILALIFFNFSAIAQSVDIEIITPKYVKSGNDFTVELLIKKMDLKAYAEFEQILLNGFNAKLADAGAADFHFSENKVNLVWINFPEEKVIKAKYYINTDKNFIGSVKLTGQLNYFINGHKAAVNLREKEIFITDTLSEIFVHRTVIQSDKDLYWNINIDIYKMTKQGKALVIDTIPAGFMPVYNNTEQINYSYDNNILKIEFLQSEDINSYKIFYQLKPDYRIYNLPQINGSYIYFETDEKITIPIIDASQNIFEYFE